MKINKNSWHYDFLENRIVQDMSYDMPENLCPYIRSLLVQMFSTFIVFFGAIFFVFVPILILPYTLFYVDFLNGDTFTLFELWKILGIMMGFLLAVFIVITLNEEYNLTYKFTRCFTKNNEPKKKEPNIFIEWIKAKHNKICPKLDFED